MGSDIKMDKENEMSMNIEIELQTNTTVIENGFLVLFLSHNLWKSRDNVEWTIYPY